jgi:hypothetical protein
MKVSTLLLMLLGRINPPILNNYRFVCIRSSSRALLQEGVAIQLITHLPGLPRRAAALLAMTSSCCIYTMIGITPSYAIQVVKEEGRPVLKLTRAECDELLIDHVPDADVAYKEGVDVDGNFVEPADLAGSPKFDLPEVIEIPLEAELKAPSDTPDSQVAETNRILSALADLQQGNPIQSPSATGQDGENKLLTPETEFGKVSVNLKTGEVLLNDKPLHSEFMDKVRKACGGVKDEEERKLRTRQESPDKASVSRTDI